MSCSKPLPSFVCDSLYYLNRNQLDRFSIVCRSLKNFIERYLHSRPYRVFTRLEIRGGSYALFEKAIQWHPNRDDNSVQQFLAGQQCNIRYAYYSFAEMRPYLGPTIRIKHTDIYVAGESNYNQDHIGEMESISYLWRDRRINVWHADNATGQIVAEDFLPILNSPSILQCQQLYMHNSHISFKDYNVLYAVKVIHIRYYGERDTDIWQQFLEQPGVKPVIVFHCLHRKHLDELLDRLSKAFSSAILPNSFKIVFARRYEPLTEFRESNKALGETLELKKGLPVECQNIILEQCDNYSLERSSV